MLRVMVVEDDPVILQAVAMELQSQKGFSVVAQCKTAGEALACLERGLEFEVALIDLGLPDRSGHEVLRSISAAREGAALVVFTQFDDPESIVEALKSGACGYLLKTTPPSELCSALFDASQGGAPLSPKVARWLVESIAGRRRRVLREKALTARESEVLALLADGASYAQAAETLGVELSTVQTHVKGIYRKLRVRSKEAATAWARLHGVLRPPKVS